MKNSFKSFCKDNYRVFVTRHAFERGYERCRLPRQALVQVANEAWQKGSFGHGNVGAHLWDISNRYDPWHTIVKLYRNVCFIFSDDRTLITLYPLFGKTCDLRGFKDSAVNGDGILFAVDFSEPICFVLTRTDHLSVKTIFCFNMKGWFLWHKTLGEVQFRRLWAATSSASSKGAAPRRKRFLSISALMFARYGVGSAAAFIRWMLLLNSPATSE